MHTGDSAKNKTAFKQKSSTLGFGDWSKVDGLLFCGWRPQPKFFYLVICQCHVGTNILDGSQKKHFIIASTKYLKAHLPLKFYEKTWERIQIGGRFNFLKIAPNWLPVILCRPKVCEISTLRFATYLIRWNRWKSQKHFSIKRIVFTSPLCFRSSNSALFIDHIGIKIACRT